MRGAEAKTAWSGEGLLFGRARFQRSGQERAADSNPDDSQRREAGWAGLGWLRFAGSCVPGKLGLGRAALLLQRPGSCSGKSLLRSPMLRAALSALRKHEADGGVEFGLGLCSLSFPMWGRILGLHADVGGVVACGHGSSPLKSFWGLHADASVGVEYGHGSCHHGCGS